VWQLRAEEIIEAFENDDYGKLLLNTPDYFSQRFFIETSHRSCSGSASGIDHLSRMRYRTRASSSGESRRALIKIYKRLRHNAARPSSKNRSEAIPADVGYADINHSGA